jgi:L-ascorbate metabolism protein UlaG (beta-lactamase superfamily)
LLLHWAARFFVPPASAKHSPMPEVRPEQVAICFAGHSTALIRYRNLTILTDPMLGSWCKGVRREVAPGISPAECSDTDLILITHGAPDHLHEKTLAKLPRAATIITPPRTAHRVSQLGFARVIELRPDQSVEHRRVDIAAVAVQHGSKAEPATAYIIRGEGPSLFFCGAGGYSDTFSRVGEKYAPDIALLPIGGYSPRSFRRDNMSPLDALYAFEDLRSKIMIPIRHGSFALSYERVHAPGRWLAELISERNLDGYVVPMSPGESRIFVRPEARRRALRRAESVEIDMNTGEHAALAP